jgi:hypothetical protein
VIKNYKKFEFILRFFIFVSFKQRIWDANKFGYAKRFSKCDTKEWVFRDSIIINFE